MERFYLYEGGIMRLILEFIIVFIVLYIVNKLLFTKKVKKGKKNKDKMRPEIMYLVTLYKLDIKKIDINNRIVIVLHFFAKLYKNTL